MGAGSVWLGSEEVAPVKKKLYIDKSQKTLI
jgi:hypothetical protein